MTRPLILAAMALFLVFTHEDLAGAEAHALGTITVVGLQGFVAVAIVGAPQTGQQAVVQMKPQFLQCGFNLREGHLGGIVLHADTVLGRHRGGLDDRRVLQ